MELKSWGVSYNSDISYANNFKCQNCRWPFTYGADRSKYIVGFSKESPMPSQGFIERIGIIIIECPECHSKFWYHITESLAEMLRRRCPNWPRE